MSEYATLMLQKKDVWLSLLSPFLAAAADPGAAVVDEDADHDEGEAEDHGQDGPEQRRVELLPSNLQARSKGQNLACTELFIHFFVMFF